MKLRQIALLLVATVGMLGASLALTPLTAHAADGEFYLQVSPSPLVVTLKPGQTTSYDLKIRNAGTAPENLTIAPRSFTIKDNGDVAFDDTKKPAEIGDWVSFSQAQFTVQPGEWYTQKVRFAIPAEAGFSYSFALVITRQDASQTTESNGRALKGSVGIFALVNIDKPGATRVLELEDISSEHGVYEYLPAKINVRLKNTGNSIVRPSGNVFIQRGSSDEIPINALPVNESEGYILPGNTRTLSTNWLQGYPAITTTTDTNGQTKEEQDWNLAHLSDLRIGYYTAKVVAIYNDGQRDVPVMGEVGFWVIPWKIILGVLVVVGLIGAGVWSITSKLVKSPVKRYKGSIKFKK